MKIAIHILLPLILFEASAQTEDSLSNGNFFEAWSSSNTVMAAEYGIISFQIHDLNDDFKASNGYEFSNYLGMVGVSISECLAVNRKYSMDAHLDFAYYHSNPVVHEKNDSTRYGFGGFHIGIDGCKDLFPKRRSFDFLIGFGFNSGRITFGNWNLNLENAENRNNRYRNPFFAPKLSLEHRVILFNKLTLSIRSEIQIDVSNHGWKQKNSLLPTISNVAATGYNTRITIGWKL